MNNRILEYLNKKNLNYTIDNFIFKIVSGSINVLDDVCFFLYLIFIHDK